MPCWSHRSETGTCSRRWSRRMATFSWAVNRLRVFLAMGRPPLEIVAYSSGPSFPFRLKQDKRVRDRDLSVERNEEMYVVRHAAGRRQGAALGSEDAADVIEEPGLDPGRDQRSAVLGTEDQVMMEASEGLRHGGLLSGAVCRPSRARDEWEVLMD